MNHGELKTRVTQYLEAGDTTFLANLPQFIRMAEDEIYRKVDIGDLSRTEPFTFPIGQELVNLSSDFLSLNYLSVTVGAERRMMLVKDQAFLREFSTPGETGVPRFFTVYSESQIMIAPPADATYTGEISYLFNPTSLADLPDDGTTWLSRNAEQALLFGTMVQGYVYLKGDQDVISAYQDKYMAAVTQLEQIIEDNNKRDTFRRPS
jgi:hypothetical protein